jgi:hypothetical protein
MSFCLQIVIDVFSSLWPHLIKKQHKLLRTFVPLNETYILSRHLQSAGRAILLLVPVCSLLNSVLKFFRPLTLLQRNVIGRQSAPLASTHG